MSPSPPPCILILGARGRLGGALARRLRGRFEVLAMGREEVDLSRCKEGLETALRRLRFDAMINCAAVTSPDACEDDPALAWKVNGEAPGRLAEVCAARGVRLIQISTDYVFAGNGERLLTEADVTEPVNVYGETKLAGERAVLAECPAALVARVSWLFGPDKGSFPDMILRQARRGEDVSAIADKWSTPTSTEDVAQWIEAILCGHPDLSGVVHLCNSGVASWREYGQATLDLALELGLLTKRVVVAAETLEGFQAFKARRPRYTPLSHALLTARTGMVPRPWRAALRSYLQEVREREVCAAAI